MVLIVLLFYIVNFLNRIVGLGGQAELWRLRVDDDKHCIRVVRLDQIVDGNIVAMQAWACVVPADYFLSR